MSHQQQKYHEYKLESMEQRITLLETNKQRLTDLNNSILDQINIMRVLILGILEREKITKEVHNTRLKNIKYACPYFAPIISLSVLMTAWMIITLSFMRYITLKYKLIYPNFNLEDIKNKEVWIILSITVLINLLFSRTVIKLNAIKFFKEVHHKWSKGKQLTSNILSNYITFSSFVVLIGLFLELSKSSNDISSEHISFVNQYLKDCSYIISFVVNNIIVSVSLILANNKVNTEYLLEIEPIKTSINQLNNY